MKYKNLPGYYICQLKWLTTIPTNVLAYVFQLNACNAFQAKTALTSFSHQQPLNSPALFARGRRRAQNAAHIGEQDGPVMQNKRRIAVAAPVILVAGSWKWPIQPAC
jgi:hypothetical protein